LRVTVPLRVTLLPLGPVTVPVWLQTPPEQLVLPLRVVVPRGPVYACPDEQVPPEQEPDPVELQELPRGPAPLPDRDQASALEVPAAISAVARMAGTRVVLNEAMCLLHRLQRHIPARAEEIGPGPLQPCFRPVPRM